MHKTKRRFRLFALRPALSNTWLFLSTHKTTSWSLRPADPFVRCQAEDTNWADDSSREPGRHRTTGQSPGPQSTQRLIFLIVQDEEVSGNPTRIPGRGRAVRASSVIRCAIGCFGSIRMACWNYSYRSATIGSIKLARRAGMTAEDSAISANTAMEPATVAASDGVIPNSCDEMYRLRR